MEKVPPHRCAHSFHPRQGKTPPSTLGLNLIQLYPWPQLWHVLNKPGVVIMWQSHDWTGGNLPEVKEGPNLKSLHLIPKVTLFTAVAACPGWHKTYSERPSCESSIKTSKRQICVIRRPKLSGLLISRLFPKGHPQRNSILKDQGRVPPVAPSGVDISPFSWVHARSELNVRHLL